MAVSFKFPSSCCYLHTVGMVEPCYGSSSGVVVKFLACGAGGPGFDFRSHRYEFRDWLSHASKSRYG